MSAERDRINVVEGVSGSNIAVTQVYAPGQIGLTPDVLVKTGNTTPFSADWLIFAEESISFFGRDAELAAIEKFLIDSRSFVWWAVVGPGGTGKSRMALEAVKRLPQDWTGGFIPKGDVSVQRVAGSQPVGNTLWVLDYAGSQGGEKLRTIISTFYHLAYSTEHKVRLLLLERGYSEESGWWADMMKAIGRERGAVNASSYREPMPLTTLADGTRAFVNEVVNSLPESEGQILRRTLDRISDEWLMEHSDHGNPLILQMLASEIVRSAGEIPVTQTPGARGILESYFAREIEMLRDRSKNAGLNFAHALDLLFVTTSMFPLTYLREFDRLLLSTPDGKVILNRVLSRIRGCNRGMCRDEAVMSRRRKGKRN